ncbi:MAG: protein PhnA [Motiliproteus sp.]
MAKGLHDHQLRNQGLSKFGKDLTRRAGSCCELCEAGGVKLSIHEVPPVPVDPDYDYCTFLCEHCIEQLEYPKRRDSDYWYFLSKRVWHEVPAVQVLAVWMCRQLSNDAPWAAELLEQLYLPPEIDAWLLRLEKLR